MIANPYTALRLSTPLTMEQIAEKAGISKQYISMVERGMYPSVNKRLTQVLIEETGGALTESEVTRAYNEWKSAKRKLTIEEVRPTPVASGSQSLSQPQFIRFRAWREYHWDSIYAFCEAFCLRTYDVTRYESGRMQGMPVTVARVLEPFGLLEGFKVNRR